MFERLEELKRVCQDKARIKEIILQAIEAKRQSIKTKQRVLEVMDMLIINRVNMTEELEFMEKRACAAQSAESARKAKEDSYYTRRVAELVVFFESAYKAKSVEK
ncbi:uncharacterized protein NEMAJ01_0099 [Nematocida major]|uniref:uncharacterized protein n=1 Tax=Nematocida major TaxID=1912982 RepID=UPI002007272A|nr:uncharacterized protein NEMAJ01_0099 [Nematocida major]KAH9385203.1 hypothetical protein NEMAJ01_0099 [Nematocida major]